MSEVGNQLFSAILQIIVFSLIPFVFFLFRKDKSVSFFTYIGLYPPGSKANVYALAVAALFLIPGILLPFVSEELRQAVLTPPSVTGMLHQKGLSTETILTLLIIAWLKTSLSEEIFFRGFLAKQLIRRLGYRLGNLIQALLFGLIHLLLFAALTKTAWAAVIGIFLFSTLAGYSIGYIKEKYGRGSIIPGWLAHAMGNTVSYAVLSFCL